MIINNKSGINYEEINRLKKISNNIRSLIIEMLFRIGLDYKGHPGPALSIVDLITCLYFKVLSIDPKNPNWSDRDRFILSKGHACPALYVALALKGYFDKSCLLTFRHIGSILQGHPDMRKTPGIDMTTGSLGNGLGAGIGVALSAKIDKKNFRTFVLLGDGEMQEGLVWESIMMAGHYRLNNLIAIIDRNKWQSCDSVENTINIEPLFEKLDSFNWDIIEINGHDIKEIMQAFSKSDNKKPKAIIANTTKGKGISFMEENNMWHQYPITEENYNIAKSELEKEY